MKNIRLFALGAILGCLYSVLYFTFIMYRYEGNVLIQNFWFANSQLTAPQMLERITSAAEKELLNQSCSGYPHIFDIGLSARYLENDLIEVKYQARDFNTAGAALECLSTYYAAYYKNVANAYKYKSETLRRDLAVLQDIRKQKNKMPSEVSDLVDQSILQKQSQLNAIEDGANAKYVLATALKDKLTNKKIWIDTGLAILFFNLLLMYLRQRFYPKYKG